MRARKVLSVARPNVSAKMRKASYQFIRKCTTPKARIWSKRKEIYFPNPFRPCKIALYFGATNDRRSKSTALSKRKQSTEVTRESTFLKSRCLPRVQRARPDWKGEGYISILNRGLIVVFHSVGALQLQRYANESYFRYNYSVTLGLMIFNARKLR
jgi:hypothetical protein